MTMPPSPFEGYAFSVFAATDHLKPANAGAPVLLECLSRVGEAGLLSLDTDFPAASALSDEEREWWVNMLSGRAARRGES